MRRLLAAPMLVVFGWAVVGLLLGHVASYDLVYPDGHVHAEVLAASGHEWLWLLEPSIVLGLVVASLAGLVGSRGPERRAARFRILALIQVSAFVGIEIVERLAHGVDLPEMTHQLTDHGLWLVVVIGVGAQLLTAWLGSAASRFVADAAHEVPRPRTAVPARPGLLPGLLSRVVSAQMVLAHACRAPPATFRSRTV